MHNYANLEQKVREMKEERTLLEKIIVNAWGTVVFFGVFMFALEFPLFLNELFKTDIFDSFTIKLGCLIGCVWLYAKSNEIKHTEESKKRFEEVQQH